MALLKPYAASRNYVIPGMFDTNQHIGSSYLWALYRMLTNAAGIPAFDAWSDSGAYAIPAWTIDHSCDSVTAGTPHDGVDRWGCPYNPAVLVWNTEGSAHSWMVLKSPAGICSLSKTRNSGGNVGPFYWLIDLDQTTGYQVDLFVSKVGFGVSGGTPGTSITRPTATDELKVSGAGLGSIPSFWQNHGVFGNQRNMSLIFANDGTFWAALVQPGASPNHVEAAFFGLERDNDARQLDLNPLVSGLAFSNAGNAPFCSGDNNIMDSSYFYYSTSPAVQYAPASTGTKLGAAIVGMSLAGNFLTTATLMGGQATSSDNQFLGWDARLFAQDQAQTYHDDLGRLADCFLAPYVPASNTPNDGLFEAANKRVKVGNLWMPCTGAINL